MQVYDVSSYLDEHPGGDDVVLAVTGTDLFTFFILKLLQAQNNNEESLLSCHWKNLN